LRSRDGGVVSSERESTQKKASIRQKGRKTNKRTKDGGTKNLKKVPTWHFSASKARQTFRGLTRRLFTKK
jgi:hypothetical protein